jgi:hypothetical protein
MGQENTGKAGLPVLGGGVRWRPGLTDNQIVLPKMARAHTANE